MKKILLTLILIFIVGCAPAPKFICPDGETIVDDKSKCPSVQEAEPATVIEPIVVEEKDGDVPTIEDKPTPPPAETKTVEEQTMDPDLQKILDKIDKVSAYEFTYQYGTRDVIRYTVVGDKVKVTLLQGNVLYDKFGYYDRVLLDTREKTAIAYCVERSACNTQDKKVAKNVPYEEFAMAVDPMQLLNSIEDAKITGGLTCDDNRACTIIKFKEDGQEVEMRIDNFYGFPYYWSKGGVEHDFSGIIYNPKNPEVQLPDIIGDII